MLNGTLSNSKVKELTDNNFTFASTAFGRILENNEKTQIAAIRQPQPESSISRILDSEHSANPIERFLNQQVPRSASLPSLTDLSSFKQNPSPTRSNQDEKPKKEDPDDFYVGYSLERFIPLLKELKRFEKMNIVLKPSLVPFEVFKRCGFYLKKNCLDYAGKLRLIDYSSTQDTCTLTEKGSHLLEKFTGKSIDELPFLLEFYPIKFRGVVSAVWNESKSLSCSLSTILFKLSVFSINLG